MSTPTPTRTVTFRIPAHTLSRITEHQARTGLSRTAIILLALPQGLDILDAQWDTP